MRIGIVSGEYPPMQGGVGAYSSIIAEHFADYGHYVSIFSTQQAHAHHPQIHLTNDIQHWNMSSPYKIKRWAKSEQLEVVNLQFETAAYGMSPWIHFLPDLLGKTTPVVTTFHDLLVPYLFPKAGKLREWIIMHLAKSSSGVIVTNHEDYYRVAHIPNARMIPIGSNILTSLPHDYSSTKIRTQVGTSEQDFLIAYFGFINRSKGIETLLGAVSQLREENFPIRLMMIGGLTGTSDPSNAAYAQEIDELVNQLHLHSVLHWTGFVEDTQVAQLLAAADVIVLPFNDGASYRRGSLMAAIQHGCAIITTEPKVEIPSFRHCENMLLVPIGDTQAVVEDIKQLASATDLVHRLKQGALELRKLFQWDNIAEECLDFFEVVTMGRRS